MDNETDILPTSAEARSGSAWSLFELVVLATAVAGVLYFGYFLLAPWIWSQNQSFRADEIAVWQLLWLQDRDGIELYTLYIMMFLDLFLVYLLSYVWRRNSAKTNRNLLFLPLVVACVFVGSVGFHPPMNTLASRTAPDILIRSFTLMLAILLMIALLHHLQQYSKFLVLAVASILLIPVCFTSTAPIEWYDYSFVLAPSLSLLQGSSISDVYFPYDLLLSLFGLAWMKLHLELNSFQVIGQCAYYLLCLGIFAFSMRWFLDKRLPVFLLITLVLVRIYAGPFDSVHAFQLTPLRIDLWVILLILVYFKGPYHWSVGLSCGLMLLLHKNFGIIYAAAYIQLLLTLCYLEASMHSSISLDTLTKACGNLLRKNSRNFTLMLLGICANYLLFREANEAGRLSFENLRISFTKISEHSFYWYVVIVSGMSFTLLMRLRSRLSGNYLATSLCLIYLAIGNSLYFFGHSHENAIIVLSAVLLLLFFLLLDLAGCYLGSDTAEESKSIVRRNQGIIMSLVLIITITIWNGDNITRKATVQAQNVLKNQFVYPSAVPKQAILNVISEVKSVTGDNPRVYFVGDYDLLFYYFGGYAQVGYYNPVYSWISRYEFIRFLQGLVDRGYFLVVDDGLVDVLSPIGFSNSRRIEGRWVIWK